MKKLHLLTLAAATVLTLGGLAGCGQEKNPTPDTGDKDPVTPDTPDATKKNLKIVVKDAKDKYQVGQKAKFEFQVDGKKLENKDDLCGGKSEGTFKVTYSVEGIATLREWDDYVAFSKPGKVKITVSSKFYNPASVEFTVIPRQEVAGKMNLVISGPAAQADFLTEVTENYNATLPADKQINFILEDHGEDKVDSEVLDWKQGPDVFAFASDKIAELYKKGALAKLGKEQENHIKTTMTDGAIEAAAFPTKNNFLAYPYAGDNGYYLFYNKAEVTEAQTATIEGLLDLAKTKGKKVAYPLNTAFYSAGALFTYGARYTMDYDTNGKLAGVDADFDTEKGVKAGKAILKIMTHEAYQEKQAAPTNENGLIACVDGSWNAAAYKKTLGENFACTKLPTVSIDGDVKNLSSFLGYKLYGVNKTKDAERTQAAHDFATYLTSAEVQKLRFEKLSIAPTNKETVQLEAVQNDPAIKAINTQAQFAVAQTAVPANVWSAPQVFTQAIIEKKVTEANIGEFMTALNKSIKESK